MKIICAVALVAMAVAANRLGAEPRVEIAFSNPDAFTDARPDDLDQLKAYVEREATKYVPKDSNLSVTFTDVDLAGRIEWGRGPAFTDLRIVRDIYPPRIALRFKLARTDGTVVRADERRLSDMSFLMKSPYVGSGPLRHEKALIDDWLRREFAGAGS